MERLGAKALWLEGAGYTVRAIAARLGVPDYTVRRALSRARANTFSAKDREETRQRVLLGLEELHDEAVAAGNIGEARKALMDMARVTGIVSTGGNVLVGVKVQQHLSDGELERRLEAWLDRQESDPAQGTV